MSNAVWKSVAGFEGYQVSSEGQIKLKDGSIARGKPSKLGYVSVNLRKDGRNKVFMVHRLVASNFLTNPDTKPLVNHINGVKHDNRLVNLEWVTTSENTKHAVVTGLRKTAKGPDNSLAKWTRSEVLLMRFLHMQGLSNAEIARRFNCPRVTSIQRIIAGKRYTNV